MAQSVLLIEDNPSDAKTVVDALTGSRDAAFRVEWVTSCAEGVQRLNERTREASGTDAIAAVLVDLCLSDSQGIETFDRLSRAAPHIPILVLSALQDEAVGRLAVERGAHDYLLKASLYSYLLPKALRSMVERAEHLEELFEEKERAQVTLNSIGDAVVSTDDRGNVTYLNKVAEGMTGWSLEEAAGHQLEEVLRLVDATTRTTVANPLALAIRRNETIRLTPNCVLIRRDGFETAIEDSAAPIHDRRGLVIGAVMVFRDVSAARELSRKMAHMAQHDGLTDLPNKATFNDRLSQAIAMARRRGQRLAVLFLDVDHFKDINDSLGHSVGDHVLQWVGTQLRACVRSSDTVSRQGGDEFVILLSEVAYPEDAAIIADKMLSALRTPCPIEPTNDLCLTASIGITTYPDDGTDGKTLTKRADFAMYCAKRSGGDQHRFFNPYMNVNALRWACVDGGLRTAPDELQPARASRKDVDDSCELDRHDDAATHSPSARPSP